jgi:biopolymer transport protein ExbD
LYYFSYCKGRILIKVYGNIRCHHLSWKLSAMAEIENKKPGSNTRKFSFKKKNTRVDLTPMVDLGFLLITFFVFTTTLSTPTVMKINMPFDKVKPGDNICESCVLTVFLEKNNLIRYYEGMPESRPVLRETFFGDKGIRDIILQKKKAVKKVTGMADDFVLIIKPSDESSFQNFVDLLDEVTFNNVKHYYTSEMDETDRKYLLHQPN